MRSLIAFLAALALLVNPVAAAAAQFACVQGQTAMAGMDQPQATTAMDRAGQAMAAAPASADPCCDHTSGKNIDDKSCAQACATTCAVLVALPYAPASQALTWTPAAAHITAAVWPHGHDPSGLERPPKSIL